MSEETHSKQDWRHFRRMLRLGKPYRVSLLFGFLLLLLQVFSTNALPLLIQRSIDGSISAEAPGTPLERLARLNDMALWMGGLVVAMFLFRISHAWMMTVVGQKVLRDLRVEVFQKVLDLPMRRVEQLKVGRLMTRATSDLDAMQELVSNGVIGLLANILLLLGAMSFVWVLEWRLALTMYTVFPLLAGLLWLINRKSREAQRVTREKVSALNSLTQESLNGLFTVRSLGQSRQMERRLGGRSEAVRVARSRVADWGTWHFPVLELNRGLAQVLIIGVALYLGDIPAGTVVAFLAYIRTCFRPLEELAEQSLMLQSGLASAERVFDLLDEAETLPEPQHAKHLPEVQGALHFDQVHFGYDPKVPVLHGLDFRVEPGQFVAVVGATGAGKSTLFNLLCRFYDVQSGAVRLDGVDVRDLPKAELRRHLGMVQQDPLLFAGTVRENLELERPGIGDEEIRAAAKRVHAHEFIEQLPRGYDTELGEGGFRLSTGQKQLLALARVLLQDPELLLLLDEATASIDSRTEALIQEGLRDLRQGRTCIAIAHRLSTVMDADQILVLKQGRLVQQGPHGQLMQESGYYRSLVEAMRAGVDV